MTITVLSTILSACLLMTTVDGGMVQFNPIESLFSGGFMTMATTKTHNISHFIRDPHAPTPEEREAERVARRARMRERNERIKEAMKNIRPETVERVSEDDLKVIQDSHPSLRKLSWSFGSSGESSSPYVDPGEDYDMWQQAYRMLGGFIDCDHDKSQNQGGGGDHNNNNNNHQGETTACSRWMLWASYVDPNYQGNGYNEYFGDNPTGKLDCHNPNTDWQLLGVYRQEFYQFIEQISKHLWAYDEYEYIVAVAGLAYMTKYECFQVGKSKQGDALYASVAPKPYGKFEMALYTDPYCLTPDEDTGYTYDDFGGKNGNGNNQQGGNNNNGGDYSQWWQDTQEYTFTQLNDVYEPFKYCTSCIDYPTYQDGYVIGDTGTDDDDLINQCWKFYSHSSYPCESDCIAMANAQGNILSVTIGDKMYGQPLSDFYSSGSGAQSSSKQSSASSGQESQFSRLLANVFVTFSFIVFVATFLAFAVARRSRYRESRSSRSRRLLDGEDETSPRSKRSSRSKSKEGGGDGLFRSASRKSSRSKSRSKSKQKSQATDKDDDYEQPRRSSRRSSSRGRVDDF